MPLRGNIICLLAFPTICIRRVVSIASTTTTTNSSLPLETGNSSNGDALVRIGGTKSGYKTKSHSGIIKAMHPVIIVCTSMRDTVCTDPT
jgi:hypothetical protein